MNFSMISTIYIIFIVIFSFLLTFQGSLSLWQMITAWRNESELDKNSLPKKLLKPEVLFSILVPAYKEEAVIADTLTQLAKQNYPTNLFEIILPLYEGDTETVKEVKRIQKTLPGVKIKPFIFKEKPVNKPDGLNKVFHKTVGDYVVIFDAEDHVNPNLLSVINTLILQEGRNVIQTGVRLVNWDSNWYSLHNSLEYFFWFASRLNWHAKSGFAPLGGVGVFFPVEVLMKAGGWDANCLTEDAQLGLACSVKGLRFRILNNRDLDTQEESPTTITAFIKQRTRWIQGFLQIFSQGKWLSLSWINKINFVILFLFPIINFGLFVWCGISLILATFTTLPVSIVLLSFFPFSLLIGQLMISIVGVWEILKLNNQENQIVYAIIKMFVTFIPYQLLIAACGIRALHRNLRKSFDWEKTSHHNIHRNKYSVT